jgi:hypothetical protein
MKKLSPTDTPITLEDVDIESCCNCKYGGNFYCRYNCYFIPSCGPCSENIDWVCKLKGGNRMPRTNKNRKCEFWEREAE